jgi:hypothetical protein
MADDTTLLQKRHRDQLILQEVRAQAENVHNPRYRNQVRRLDNIFEAAPVLPPIEAAFIHEWDEGNNFLCACM